MQTTSLSLLAGLLLAACADPDPMPSEPESVAEAVAGSEGWTFSVVPQQSASKTAAQWVPLLASIRETTGIPLVFETRKDIPTFEETLADGLPDLAYMNPYHYAVFHESAGYEALARAKDKRIKGIMVARKDSEVESLGDLEGMEVAFPAPAAFAATLLSRAELAIQSVDVVSLYVGSHDSVYRNVAAGASPAGGGIVRTFNAMPEEVSEQLRVIWTSDGFTPHAIAAHPRVPVEVVEAIRAALIGMDQTPGGAEILERIKIKGFERGEDKDWDDVRALNLEAL